MGSVDAWLRSNTHDFATASRAKARCASQPGGESSHGSMASKVVAAAEPASRCSASGSKRPSLALTRKTRRTASSTRCVSSKPRSTACAAALICCCQERPPYMPPAVITTSTPAPRHAATADT
eukprot:6203991-Pleurochrysis_carterae.AAC.1